MKKLYVLLAFGFILSACDQPQSSTEKEAKEVDSGQQQVIRNLPAPIFTFPSERRILIEIYKARQSNTLTYSVVQNEYTGKILWACDSIGYPLPYSTQLTNPNQIVYQHFYNTNHSYGGDGVLPQAEPNGLYPPSTSEGTWIPCVNAQGNITPIYEEKKVSVFPFPVEEKDGKLTPVVGKKSSIEISTTGK